MSTAIAALPFFSGELSGFDPSTNTIVEVTHLTPYNPAFARCAIFVPPQTQMSTPTWPVAADFYYHFDLTVGLPFDPVNDGTILQFFDGATEVMRMTATGETSMTWKFYTLQGGVITLAGSFTVPTLGTGINTYDIRLKAGAGTGGIIQVWSADSPVFTVNNLDHNFTGVTQAIHHGCGFTTFNSTEAYWSQVIGDAVSHVGDRLKTFPLDTNSAVNTGWTGGVTDINEIVLNDANFAAAATPALVSTYYANGFSLAGYNILAVGVAARAQVVGAGPAHLNLALRSGGANFFSEDIAQVTGYQASFHSWVTNPSGGGAWLAADAQAVEGGQRSVA